MLVFNDQGQIQESHVFRQAPEDEMTYFLAQWQSSEGKLQTGAAAGGSSA